MNLIETLSANNIKKALIIDDGFDSIPLASDLYSNDSGWDIFFDDVSEHVAVIA